MGRDLTLNLGSSVVNRCLNILAVHQGRIPAIQPSDKGYRVGRDAAIQGDANLHILVAEGAKLGNKLCDSFASACPVGIGHVSLNA